MRKKDDIDNKILSIEASLFVLHIYSYIAYQMIQTYCINSAHKKENFC